ncbi:MAG: putative ATP-dependent endonuclease of OLD family [Oleiphilaceae bacterium]|jgi:putative ATP-dependent endonuclease of OLD family
MKLQSISLFNFQCFGPEPTVLSLEDLTFLIGPNGSGKTAITQALCRMFALDPALKRIQKSDFHVPHDEDEIPDERPLWLEANFTFPELLEDTGNHTTVPVHFAHMRLDAEDGIPRVRFRLDASIGLDGDIEDTFSYVLDLKEDGTPLTTALVPRPERNNIQVHYLPARRDPADHIAFGANALLGRLLRAVNWDVERTAIKKLTDQISNSLASNTSVETLSAKLSGSWQGLHKGRYFTDPSITFAASEIEALLRHLSVSFTSGHDEKMVDFSRLSDGQKSMLYLSLVLTSQKIGRSVLNGEDTTFDINKLRPAVFTIIALEEPENSLSPHYLGRIVSALVGLVDNEDAQALIATHAPSMLRRTAPENIRYLRLNEVRQTQITHIQMPQVTDDAHKFVREAVQAFPELYFSRLVVLGEGDSEEIVLPRLLKAKGTPIDECAISVVPLGGRHVNHFWRLLSALDIPFITLLDMDLARHQGGWGRVKYINDQLGCYNPDKQFPKDWTIPKWDNDDHLLLEYTHYLDALETKGIFFSSPMDIDFAMLSSFPGAFDLNEADQISPIDSKIKAVLGDRCHGVDQYTEDQKKLFVTYHKRFKLSSKPATHINALSNLTDTELLAGMPPSLSRLADYVSVKLVQLPE